MTKIIIVGAGRVGIACASLLMRNMHRDILLVDSSKEALNIAHNVLTGPYEEDMRYKQCDTESLDAVLTAEQPFAVICATPFQVNIQVATICAKLQCHYLDFTEDVLVRKHVETLNPKNSVFVLQAGLAPGLITSVGLNLCDQLKALDIAPDKLELRVGALPKVGTLPAAYSMTWSAAGLINEYLQPVECIRDGKVEIIDPLDDHEDLILSGQFLEAFNTSGGMSAPSIYLSRGLTDVTYKTIRYPGHLDFLQRKIISQLDGLNSDEKLAKGIKLAHQLFTFTREDVVHLVARATGNYNGARMEKTAHFVFEPNYDLTALELTTAGHGVACIELLRDIEPGIVFGGELDYTKISNTVVGKLFCK